MNSSDLLYEEKLNFFRQLKFKVGKPDVDLYYFRGEVEFKSEKGQMVT
jgi:hypothetical protein